MTKYFGREKVVAGILQQIGVVESVGGVSVTVVEKDNEGLVAKCRGLTVPSSVAGYALECEFVDTDKTAGTHKLYRNIGTTSSCTFDLVGEISAADITDESITLADIADNQVGGKLNIYNDTGGTLTAGTLVRVIGYTGVNGLKVEKADADANKPATHFVPTAINNSASGDIHQLGTLTGYNTGGRTIGDPVYMDPTTAGGLTFTAPTGSDQVSQQVGVVVTVDAAGSVFLFPGLFGFLKFGQTFLQDQSVNAAKLDSGMFIQYGGLAKDGSNLRSAITIYNNTGGTLNPGEVVRLTGFDTTNGVTVTKADADAGAFGTHVVVTSINNSASGLVAPMALIQSQNTAGRTIGDLLYLDATTAGGWTATAPSGSDQVAQVVGIVKVVDVANGEIVFFPGLRYITKLPTSMIQNGAITAQKLVESEARTATADGTGTGAITALSAFRKFVTVTSGAATDQVALPAISSDTIGQEVFLTVGANGYELITPASSNNTINQVDADGTNQLDVAANTTVRCTQISATAWLAETIAATTLAITAPDND